MSIDILLSNIQALVNSILRNTHGPAIRTYSTFGSNSSFVPIDESRGKPSFDHSDELAGDPEKTTIVRSCPQLDSDSGLNLNSDRE